METTRLAALLAVALTLAGCAGTQHNGRGARVSPPFPRPYAVNPAPALRDHGAALISARTGKHRFLSARIRGAVADGAGGWFVATASGIARMRSDGIHRPSLAGGDFDGRVRDRERRLDRLRSPGRRARRGLRRTIGSSGVAQRSFHAARPNRHVLQRLGNPLAGGRRRPRLHDGCFRKVGGASRDGLAALNARTGRLDTSWRPAVRACDDGIAFSRSRVYVGDGASRLLALDPATGARTGWHSRGRNPWYADPGVVGDVDNIFVTHGLILSSGFDTSGAITRERTGRPDPLWGRIGGIAFGAKGDILYLGGDLRRGVGPIGSESDHNLIAFDLRRKRLTAWRPSLDNYVSVGDIVPSGDNVLVLGSFANTVG